MPVEQAVTFSPAGAGPDVELRLYAICLASSNRAAMAGTRPGHRAGCSQRPISPEHRQKCGTAFASSCIISCAFQNVCFSVTPEYQISSVSATGRFRFCRPPCRSGKAVNGPVLHGLPRPGGLVEADAGGVPVQAPPLRRPQSRSAAMAASRRKALPSLSLLRPDIQVSDTGPPGPGRWRSFEKQGEAHLCPVLQGKRTSARRFQTAGRRVASSATTWSSRCS